MPTRSVNSRRDVPDDPLADGQREEGPRTELLERLDQMQQKIDAATEALAARQAELEARDAEMALREQVIAARLASVERTIPDLSGRQDLQGNDATQRTSDRGVDDQTNLHVPNETSSEEDVPEAKPVELESDMSEFKMLAKALATRLTAGSEERPAEVVSFKDPPARAPDRFDGTNRAKLRPFLTQLNIVFLHHARRFSNDQAKVLYAGSYLGGVAADWFEPILDETNLQSHRLLKDWNLFRDSLTAVFGDMNAEGTAEHELNNIKMDDRDEISTYLTQFRTYLSRLPTIGTPRSSSRSPSRTLEFCSSLSRISTRRVSTFDARWPAICKPRSMQNISFQRLINMPVPVGPAKSHSYEREKFTRINNAHSALYK